jgi:predicted NAD-dependent protein-ADP-ribosyltransferase YbiA (DUF1768 family)
MFFRGKYDFLSNFKLVPVFYDGITWSCSEIAFQAYKTLDMDERAKFMVPGLTPGKSKHMGKKVTLRPNWDNLKVSFMLDILRAKFCSGSEMAGLLLGTGTIDASA